MTGAPDSVTKTLDEAVEQAERAVDDHRRGAEEAMLEAQVALSRIQHHKELAKECLRQLWVAEDRVHEELKEFANLANTALIEDRHAIAEEEITAGRRLRSGEYDRLITAVDNHDEPPADNPAAPPADNHDVPPPCTPDARPLQAGVQPPPAGEYLQRVASYDQQPNQRQEEQDMFPGREVNPLFGECERQTYVDRDCCVVAAQRVACLLAMHNEAGFEKLRGLMSQKSTTFARKKTDGTGEKELRFRALSLLLLIRVGVSSSITDNLIADNHSDHRLDDTPFGPFVGPLPRR